MAKIMQSIIVLALHFPLFLHAMEQAVTVPVDQTTTLTSREDFANYIQALNGKMPSNDQLQNLIIAPQLKLDLLHSLTFEQDNLKESHPQLAKSVKSLHKPDTSQDIRYTKVLVREGLNHNGDLTARSISARKKEIATRSARQLSLKQQTAIETKKSETKKSDIIETIHEKPSKKHTDHTKATKQHLDLRLDLGTIHSKETIDDEEREQIQQEIQDLIFAAAENAITQKNSEARRNLLLAGIGLVSTIAGPIITYFTSNSGGDCPSNSTGF